MRAMLQNQRRIRCIVSIPVLGKTACLFVLIWLFGVQAYVLVTHELSKSGTGLTKIFAYFVYAP